MNLASKTLRGSLLSNTVAVVMLRGSTTITRIIVLFIIARLIAREEFGLIIFTLTTVEIAKVVADFGVDIFAVRKFAILSSRENQQIFASIVATTKVICGVFVYVLLLLLYLLSQNAAQTEIGVALGVLILTGLWVNFSIDYFQALLKTSQIVLPVLIINTANIAAVSLLSLTKPSALSLVSILVFFEAVSGFILFLFLKKSLGSYPRLVNLVFVVRLLRQSLPIAIGAIIVTLYTRLDVIVLNTFFDKSTIAYYGVAFRLTEPFQLISVAFAMSVYSHLSATIQTDTKRIGSYIIRYYGGVIVYGITTCVVLLTLAPYGLEIFLPDYMPAVPVLRILAIALIFRTLNSCLTSTIRAYGYFTSITIVSVWNLGVVAALLWVYVPRLGAEGAALALLISEVINTLLQSIIVQQILSGNPLLRLLRRVTVYE